MYAMSVNIVKATVNIDIVIWIWTKKKKWWINNLSVEKFKHEKKI